jgi:hypothetical protein
MKPKTQLRLLDTMIVILVLALLVLAIPLVVAYFDNNNVPNNPEEIISACDDKDLENASFCVVDITKTFFKYNLDNLDKDLDFQTLKQEGGVCENWSKYYSELGEELGFRTRSVVVSTSQNTAHAFSLWSSEEGYCILDQTELICVGLQ